MQTLCQAKILCRAGVAQSAVRIMKKTEILSADSGAIQSFCQWYREHSDRRVELQWYREHSDRRVKLQWYREHSDRRVELQRLRMRGDTPPLYCTQISNVTLHFHV